jgi:hypothetical protein
MEIAIVFLVVALVAAYVVYQDRKEKKAAAADKVEPAATAMQVYPGRLHGHFTWADRAAAVAARNASLIKHGHTPDYSQDDADNTASNNTKLGGGAPWGGIYLAGAFDFTFLGNGQVDQEKSWISIFSPERYKVQGGMNPDGTIGMASPSVGVNIRGTASRLVVAEAGMAISSEGQDAVFEGMRKIDQHNLDGIHDGHSVQYVHGVATGPAISWENL